MVQRWGQDKLYDKTVADEQMEQMLSEELVRRRQEKRRVDSFWQSHRVAALEPGDPIVTALLEEAN